MSKLFRRRAEQKKKRNKFHKKETKKYRGIEYNLLILESDSRRKWVVLESEFKFPEDLIYNLNEYRLTGDDNFLNFLSYDSVMWWEYPLEFQWEKMDEIAKQQIDELYRIYEIRHNLLNERKTDIKTTISNLEKFIESLGREKFEYRKRDNPSLY